MTFAIVSERRGGLEGGRVGAEHPAVHGEVQDDNGFPAQVIRQDLGERGRGFPEPAQDRLAVRHRG